MLGYENLCLKKNDFQLPCLQFDKDSQMQYLHNDKEQWIELESKVQFGLSYIF